MARAHPERQSEEALSKQDGERWPSSNKRDEFMLMDEAVVKEARLVADVTARANPEEMESGTARAAITRLGSTRTRLWVGVLCVLGFVILSDTRDIILENHLKISNPFDYMLIVFGIAALLYASINRIKSPSSAQSSVPGLVSNLLWLNIVTASNWLGWYLSLKYLTAPTVVALYAGIVPIATLQVNRVLRSASASSGADRLSAMLLFSCAVAWAFANVLSLQSVEAAIGVGLVVICSFSIAATTVVSKRLADLNVPASRVMAHRFYLLLGIAAVMASPPTDLLETAVKNYQVLLLASVVGTVLTLWLLQKGIERCEPVLTVVIIATSPAFSLVIYLLLTGAASIQTSTVVMSLAVVVIAVLHTVLQHMSQSRNGRRQ